MTGRVVVLQRLSGTTWTDLLTLGPGAAAGSYTGEPRRCAAPVTTGRSSGSRRLRACAPRPRAAVTIVVAAGCIQKVCPLVVEPGLP